jgi:sulfoxide reductase catalytic subunit YedY
MNSQPLSDLHGAPLRLRVENNSASRWFKWTRAIELAVDIKKIRGGEGGYNQDNEYFGELANV